MNHNIVEELRNDVRSVEQKVHEKLYSSESKLIKNFLKNKRLIIVYSGPKKIPASILYWTLAALKMKEHPPILLDIISFFTHLAPYHEDYSLLAMVRNPVFLKQLYDASKLLKINSLIILEDMPSSIKISNALKVVFGENVFSNNLGLSLYLPILAIESLSATDTTRRTKILIEELKDLSSIVPSLIERYSDVLIGVEKELQDKNGKICFIVPDYMRNVVEKYVALLATKFGRNIVSLDLGLVYESQCELLPRNYSIVLCRTGVEEHIYRYIRFNCNVSKFFDLNINVDPLSASLYLLILLEYVYRKLM